MADDNWTFTLEKVQTATRIAKERAAAHWSRRQWYLWTNFGSANQAVNPQWSDPYFENEWSYITNLPDTNPANLMTINAYYAYCWYKYKGYQDYVIAALLYSHVVESKVTGALWESLTGAAGIHPYPGNAGNWLNVGSDGVGHASYDDLRTFNPTLATASYEGSWHIGPSIAPRRTYQYNNWSFDDGVTIIPVVTLHEPVEQGSYDSARGLRINPDAVGTGSVGDPPNVQVYHYWKNSVPANQRFEYLKGSFGYGLVQWTTWDRARYLAGFLTGTFKSVNDSAYMPGYDPTTGTYYSCGKEWWLQTGNSRSQGIGRYHWQLNMTLHLMILEFQRANAMKASPVAHPELQTIHPNGLQWTESGAGQEGVYYGDWEDNTASKASWDPDFIYTTQRYDAPCTWDMWASGEFLTNPNANQRLLQEIEDDPNPPYRKARLAMDILRVCYLRSTFAMPWPAALDYWLSCIDYWKDVWSIADIPRPREFPWLGFELDYWHQAQDNKRILTLTQGRRKPHVRTVLL